MKPHNLTEGSISQRLLLFTLPILIGNILQSLNATVNSFWIGHFLGEAALTASSNAGIVLFLILGAMMGASLAATILIGQYLGARRLHDAKRVVGTSTTFAASLSILMAILGWFICEPLLRADADPAAGAAAGHRLHARDLPRAAVHGAVRLRHLRAARRG